MLFRALTFWPMWTHQHLLYYDSSLLHKRLFISIQLMTTFKLTYDIEFKTEAKNVKLVWDCLTTFMRSRRRSLGWFVTLVCFLHLRESFDVFCEWVSDYYHHYYYVSLVISRISRIFSHIILLLFFQNGIYHISYTSSRLNALNACTCIKEPG